jgi:ribosomal protein S18 acetylase RimI-like enzyme
MPPSKVFMPFINNIYLLKEYRSRGIGTGLVKYWEGSIKRKGYKSVLTSTIK